MNKQVLDKFKSVLRKENFKLTPQRICVLEEVMKDLGHRESEEIFLSINKKRDKVSRATTYRTLDILVKYNFIRKLNLGNGRAKYEVKINSHHHDHMICNRCSKIIEFVDPVIEKQQDIVAKKYNFVLESHIHQLFGMCSDCQ